MAGQPSSWIIGSMTSDMALTPSGRQITCPHEGGFRRVPRRRGRLTIERRVSPGAHRPAGPRLRRGSPRWAAIPCGGARRRVGKSKLLFSFRAAPSGHRTGGAGILGRQGRNRRARAAAVGAAEDRDDEICRPHDSSLVMQSNLPFASVPNDSCMFAGTLRPTYAHGGRERAASPTVGFAALWRFLPMLWPKDEAELKLRVIAAVVLVLAGKAVTLLGPYALKLAVDRMSAHAAFAVVAGLVWPMLARVSAASCSTICATPSSRRSDRMPRAACRQRLPARPRSVAPLPSRAPYRIADQDRRARHEEHRHDALFPPV